MYVMKKPDEIKEKRLNRIITVRISDADYSVLQNISETKGSNMSKIIRTITKPIVDLTKENNCKVK
jgi:hypothetical protein